MACSFPPSREHCLRALWNQTAHFTNKKNKRLQNFADPMSIICAMVSHSMSMRLKRNCATLSNPILSTSAFCLLFLPRSLSVVPSSASGFPKRENVPLSSGRLKRTMGSARRLERVPMVGVCDSPTTPKGFLSAFVRWYGGSDVV